MGREYFGYYKGSSAWTPVPKEEAELLTHKEANRISNRLHRLVYKGASMEPE
jgi:hypothetical protein